MSCDCRFLAGSDRDRDNTFKLIPRVTQGSWIIKQSVGTTPCLLGNKLTAKYYQCAATLSLPPPVLDDGMPRQHYIFALVP